MKLRSILVPSMEQVLMSRMMLKNTFGFISPITFLISPGGNFWITPCISIFMEDAFIVHNHQLCSFLYSEQSDAFSFHCIHNDNVLHESLEINSVNLMCGSISLGWLWHSSGMMVYGFRFKGRKETACWMLWSIITWTWKDLVLVKGLWLAPHVTWFSKSKIMINSQTDQVMRSWTCSTLPTASLTRETGFQCLDQVVYTCWMFLYSKSR